MATELEIAVEEDPVVIGSEIDIQSPVPSPKQDDSVLLETDNLPSAKGEREVGESTRLKVGSEGGSDDSNAVSGPDRLQRFYFESDALVLKNNADYQKLLKALALLEAQKMQATKDLEKLVSVKGRAERDPYGFVAALKDGTLEPLPTPQKVAELPNINWKGYMDSIQKIVKQHSAVYQRTRRKAGKEPATATKSSTKSTTSKHKELTVKPASYKQPWTPEEQTRLEELLRLYPPEAVERRRYEKVAKALGTRTPQQVASHVQKYFIKLAKAGLPVPGRMPNMAAYVSKSKKGSRMKRLNRLSTFFSTLSPRVYMPPEGGEGTSQGHASNLEEEEEDSSDSDDTDSMFAGWGPTGSQGETTPTEPASIKCSSCENLVRVGSYWECIDCPEHQTLLCPDCVNSGYQFSTHSPSHDMIVKSLFHGACTDKDYSTFTQAVDTSYNYLDPNFFPAS